MRIMNENVMLIKEINDLRREIVAAKKAGGGDAAAGAGGKNSKGGSPRLCCWRTLWKPLLNSKEPFETPVECEVTLLKPASRWGVQARDVGGSATPAEPGRGGAGDRDAEGETLPRPVFPTGDLG